MNKPIVIDRPWWRHPIFPWGWLSLRKDIKPKHGQTVKVDGYHAPGDGGGGSFVYQDAKAMELEIELNECKMQRRAWLDNDSCAKSLVELQEENNQLHEQVNAAHHLLSRWKLFGEGVDPNLARHLIADTNNIMGSVRESNEGFGT